MVWKNKKRFIKESKRKERLTKLTSVILAGVAVGTVSIYENDVVYADTESLLQNSLVETENSVSGSNVEIEEVAEQLSQQSDSQSSELGNEVSKTRETEEILLEESNLKEVEKRDELTSRTIEMKSNSSTDNADIYTLENDSIPQPNIYNSYESINHSSSLFSKDLTVVKRERVSSFSDEFSSQEYADIYSDSVGFTKEDAVAWAKSRLGQYSYYKGANQFYAGQCVALIRLFAEQKFPEWKHRGHARDYITMALPSALRRIQYTPGFIPQPGDIAIWQPHVGGGYGHVSMVIEADSRRFKSIDNNWGVGGKGGPAKIVEHNYNNFWGVIRPNYAASEGPKNWTINKNQHWYDLSDEVVITAKAEGGERYYVGLDKKGGNGEFSRFRTEPAADGVYRMPASALGIGEYSIYMSVANSAGSIDTGRVSFEIVGAPTISAVNTNKTQYNVGEIVNIKADVICSKSIEISIRDKKTNRIVKRYTTGWQGDVQFNSSELGNGEFSVLVKAINGSGYTESTEKIIKVGEVLSENRNKWYHDSTDDKWYYFDANGEKVRDKWIGDYYLKLDSKMATSQWIQTEGIWYYVDRTGKKVRNTWVGDYYLKSDSKMATSQWIQTEGVWYYVEHTGKKVRNVWIGDYYLKSDSKMATSQWIQTEGIWYYVDHTGKKVRNTWVGDYYLKSDSKMATSQWIQTEGIWYYVDHTGKKVRNIWIGDYYLKSDGKMAKNEWLNGIYVDSSGKRTNRP